MATFVPAANGYIIDVPILYVTPFGKDFPEVFDKLTSATVNNGGNSIPINGGHSNFPLTIIDTDKTQEFTFECADFSQRLFAMVNGSEIKQATAIIPAFGKYQVETGLKVILPDAAAENTVKVRGFALAEAAAAGKFTALVTPAAGEVPAFTTITFFAGDVEVGDMVDVVYGISVENAEVVSTYTNASSVVCGLKLIWPVYAGADEGSGQIGTLMYEVFKARASAMPGFNNSYKSASTFGASFTGLDPRRADKKMTDIVFAKGHIV